LGGVQMLARVLDNFKNDPPLAREPDPSGHQG
jgi:hypothetical protein